MKNKTVTREEFMKDSASVMRRVYDEGPITVLGADGKPFMIVSAPEPFDDPLEEIKDRP